MTQALEENKRRSHWPETLLFVVGVTLLATWGKTALESHVYQSREGSRLERMFSAALGTPSAQASVTRLEARTTGLIGKLEIPRLELSAIVAEGLQPRTLARAVGHVPNTAFPGEPGNVGLAGHRDTHLKKLGRIRPGDVIRLKTPDGTFVYRVDAARIVKPDRGELLAPGRVPMLTLVTCYPFRAIGPAPLRFVVSASQTDVLALDDTRERKVGR
jgi:sortase A